MATVSFDVHSYINKEGKASLRLRIEDRGDRRYVPVDLKVKPEYWNARRQRVTSSHVGHGQINTRLAEIDRTVQEVRTRLEAQPNSVSSSWLKDEIEKALSGRDESAPGGFLSFARRELEGYKRRGQTGTHKAYGSILNKFEEFVNEELGQEEVPFHRLDAALIRRFRTFCYEVRGNSANTVGKALNVIRTFTRTAIKEGHIDQADYPFEHITIDSEEVEKEKLIPEEIEEIASVTLDPDSVGAEVRRWFLFAYYAGGMRFSDVATLRPEHIRPVPGEERRRVYYRMEKTEGRTGVPLIEEAEEILDYYDERFDPWVFPILKDYDPEDDYVRKKESMNAMANKYLKKIARKTDIEKNVTFHLSRNAAAWRLYQAIGDIYKVSKILGHSSVTQTEEYLQGFEDQSLDDDFMSAF